jgi:hypothetical protein
MRHRIVFGVLGWLVTGMVMQTSVAGQLVVNVASDSVDPTRLEIEIHPVPKPDHKHSPTPNAPDENVITPNLPPPAIDPEIVHEPPPNPHPEAVIAPPKIDPDMAVSPPTLPGSSDTPNSKLEKTGPEDMSRERSGAPK